MVLTMIIKKISNLVKQHVSNNLIWYILLLCIFVSGISAGAFTVNALSEIQNEELIHYFNGLIQLLKSQNVESGVVFYQSLVGNFKLVFAIWFLGATVIGIPLIFVIIAIKGFIIGFSIGFLVSCIEFNGLLLSALTMLPKEIVIVPCLFGLAVSGINFSSLIVRNRSKKNYLVSNLKVDFIFYNILTGIFCLGTLGGILIETYFSTAIIKGFVPIFM